MNLLELQSVTKHYDGHTANKGISFNVPKGSVFGLLGPNGAGKTTLIRIITNIIGADAGEVYFDGESIRTDHKSQIGYMPEERGLYKQMKVGEHLLYLARLKDLSKSDALERIRYWMDKFDISDWWDKRIDELSKGMQQKVQFISTVLHEPKLLILDEPFSGLDPINANLIREEIAALNQKGITIIFSTHRMEQVEEICEQIVLVNQGQVLLEGQVADLKQAHKKNQYRLELKEAVDIQDASFEIVAQEGREYIVQLREGHAGNAILSYCLSHSIEVLRFEELLPSLNEIFIQAVGQNSVES